MSIYLLIQTEASLVMEKIRVTIAEIKKKKKKSLCSVFTSKLSQEKDIECRDLRTRRSGRSLFPPKFPTTHMKIKLNKRTPLGEVLLGVMLETNYLKAHEQANGMDIWQL